MQTLKISTMRILSFLMMALVASVVLAQDSVPSAPEKGEPSEAVMTEKSKPASISIELTKGQRIEGIPVDVQEVTLNTTFGEIKLPLDRGAGIRFGQGEDSTSTIELANGDSLTGSIPMNAVKVLTDWGECKVNVPFIKSIVMKKGYRWSQNGVRWRMVPSGGVMTVPPRSSTPFYSAPAG